MNNFFSNTISLFTEVLELHNCSVKPSTAALHHKHFQHISILNLVITHGRSTANLKTIDNIPCFSLGDSSDSFKLVFNFLELQAWITHDGPLANGANDLNFDFPAILDLLSGACCVFLNLKCNNIFTENIVHCVCIDSNLITKAFSQPEFTWRHLLENSHIEAQSHLQPLILHPVIIQSPC